MRNNVPVSARVIKKRFIAFSLAISIAARDSAYFRHCDNPVIGGVVYGDDSLDVQLQTSNVIKKTEIVWTDDCGCPRWRLRRRIVGIGFEKDLLLGKVNHQHSLVVSKVLHVMEF